MWWHRMASLQMNYYVLLPVLNGVRASAARPLFTALGIGACYWVNRRHLRPYRSWHCSEVDGRHLLVGNNRLIEENGIDIEGMEDALKEMEMKGQTAMLVAVDRSLAGIIGVSDTVKPGSADAILAMRQMGLEVYMITGDNRHTATAIASQVGIDTTMCFGVLPEDRQRRFRS